MCCKFITIFAFQTHLSSICTFPSFDISVVLVLLPSRMYMKNNIADGFNIARHLQLAQQGELCNWLFWVYSWLSALFFQSSLVQLCSFMYMYVQNIIANTKFPETYRQHLAFRLCTRISVNYSRNYSSGTWLNPGTNRWTSSLKQ